MLEVELKSVVDDVARRRAAIERAGATLVYEGRLEDRRWDTPDRALAARDHVLRVRTYRGEGDERAELDWKGPTRREEGYKLREEIDVATNDPGALGEILARIGYEVSMAIDREIAQYELDGAMVRFERYPRMDDLVEVEGAPASIERAIAALGLPRDGFTTDRLPEFVQRYEARTGQRAAVCDAELTGDASYDVSNA
ncbi:MAG TPA: CYTH domain-containing protein [Gemmatimonadaceae bacterium]|nr:CYTH domain-containing protein [Gemmatimonadaceae bacterium]